MRPHRWQPTRLPRPWDSPGKNTGVGCHFLLQCRKVKSEREVAQSCPTLRDPMDCSLAGSSSHGIVQARVLEWGVIAFSASDQQIARSTRGLQSLLGFFRLAPLSEPYSKWKRASSEGASWAPCGHCSAHVSCCGCLPNSVNCCCGLSASVALEAEQWAVC